MKKQTGDDGFFPKLDIREDTVEIQPFIIKRKIKNPKETYHENGKDMYRILYFEMENKLMQICVLKMKACDLDGLRDELEQKFNWSYIETEGRDCTRFDLRGDSVWVQSNGSMYGSPSLQKKINKTVEKFTS